MIWRVKLGQVRLKLCLPSGSRSGCTKWSRWRWSFVASTEPWRGCLEDGGSWPSAAALWARLRPCWAAWRSTARSAGPCTSWRRPLTGRTPSTTLRWGNRQDAHRLQRSGEATDRMHTVYHAQVRQQTGRTPSTTLRWGNKQDAHRLPRSGEATNKTHTVYHAQVRQQTPVIN